MCKDKWNSLNSDFKKLINYHKGTRNHTCFWDLTFEEKEHFHLPCQYTWEHYELIEVFRGENNINVPLYIKDVNVEGNIYKPPKQEIEDEINEIQLQNNNHVFDFQDVIADN